MFSPSLQNLVVQAHIEELHRVAQTHNLHRTFATPIQEIDRPNATHLFAGVKPAINRMLGGGRRATAAPAAIRGLELVAHNTTAPRSRS